MPSSIPASAMSAEDAGGALVLPEEAPAVAASRDRRLPTISLGIIAAFVLVAILAPLLSPADPHDQSLRNRFKPPAWEEGGSWKYPLGTDRLGRDMLSRIIWGSRVSLAAGVITVLLASADSCTTLNQAIGGRTNNQMVNMATDTQWGIPDSIRKALM